ncbi:hypothetical protein MTR67_008280 [Solanum verrucosum]|uniref:Uncharacterized protein n=1 Tax=Solanum verrucosum TaxID=315347 RepID=A0AAF0Q4W4_SOLVR|nr:hypothetical protein MTR67_008280 [Solanum verrucosum]
MHVSRAQCYVSCYVECIKRYVSRAQRYVFHMYPVHNAMYPTMWNVSNLMYLVHNAMYPAMWNVSNLMYPVHNAMYPANIIFKGFLREEMTMTQNRRLLVSSVVAKRQAMAANSSGFENNQAGKLNAGAARKRLALSNISNHTAVSAPNSISHSSKLVSVSLFITVGK